MGGSSGQQSQTTTTNLSPQQSTLLQMGMPFAQQYAANQPTLPSSSQAIAGFTPSQTSGQQQALTAAGGQQQTTANNAAGASNFLTTGQALAGPNANPFLAPAIQGAVLPARQNLELNTLPGIRQQATGVGGMGNTREGVAEGVATGLESQGEQATAAQMENSAYNTGIGAMTQALGLTPSTLAAETAPASTTSAVGDVQQQLQQAINSYNTQAGLFAAEQPLSTAEALSGMAAGIPGASTTSTGATTQNPSALQYGVGGASILGGLGGLFSTPGSAGAGGTSAISGLGSALSGLGTNVTSGLSSLFGAGSNGLASLLPFLTMAA